MEHYRCKDDLSCGYGADGQKTVGFYINPRNAKGNTVVINFSSTPSLFFPNSISKCNMHTTCALEKHEA